MEEKAKLKKGSPEWLEHLRQAGRKGGQAKLAKYGREEMGRMGTVGGNKLLAKRGREYYQRIAALPWHKHRKDNND